MVRSAFSELQPLQHIRHELIKINMIKQCVTIFAFLSISITMIAQDIGRYEILGAVSGIKDSTVLYLEFEDNNDKVLDSVFIANSKFKFEGRLRSKVVHALIKTHNYSDYKFFWLENATLKFNAEKGKFRQAGISGSKVQEEQNELDLLTNALSHKKRMEQEKKFISEHPNSIISAYMLSVYSSTWGKDTTAILYSKLADELKATSYGKDISDFVLLNKNLKVEDKYVDFSQEDTQGKQVKLSDFNGKIVLLEFWGSWCGPCRTENPELVKVYTEFKDKGFEILGVGAETKREVWLNAVSKDKLAWTNVTDLKGDKNKAALIYGISYYPSNFLIDETGTIVAKDLKSDKLRQKLKEMLK